MSFKEITERAPASDVRKMGSISLRKRGKRATKPTLFIAIKKGLLEGSQVVGEARSWSDCGIVLLIGEGDDAGKVRLRRVPKGTGVGKGKAMKGAVVFDCGHVAHFGEKAAETFDVDAKFVYDSADEEIELAVSLEEIDDHSYEDEDRPRRSAPEPPPAAAPAAPVAKPSAQPGAKPVGAQASAGTLKRPIESNGVRLEFYPRQKIFHAGDSLELTPRQASVLEWLVPALGKVVLTADLMQRTALSAASISDEFLAMSKSLGDLSLKMRFVPKMGYSLSIDA